MGASTRSLSIGVIAEEDNDIEVLYELTCKVIPKNAFAFKRFVGHGCGAVRRKCRAWAENLLQRGCTHLVILHDRDDEDELELRQSLEARLDGAGRGVSLVLIPVEELEAWLLSDLSAIVSVFSIRKSLRIPKNPERIRSPKEYLAELVRRHSRSDYLNTVHNRRIAAALSLEVLSERCPSFRSYPEFVERISRKRKRKGNAAG